MDAQDRVALLTLATVAVGCLLVLGAVGLYTTDWSALAPHPAAFDGSKIDGYDALRAACKADHCTPAGEAFVKEVDAAVDNACFTYLGSRGFGNCVYTTVLALAYNEPPGMKIGAWWQQQGYFK